LNVSTKNILNAHILCSMYVGENRLFNDSSVLRSNVAIVQPSDYFRQLCELFWQCLLKRFIVQIAAVP
jgi:hypothetical protein